jgi:hypothetical protein
MESPNKTALCISIPPLDRFALGQAYAVKHGKLNPSQIDIVIIPRKIRYFNHEVGFAE